MSIYKIQSGDTLSSIAKKYNTTVDELVSLNGIANPNLIYSGTELKLPGTNTQTESTTKTETTAKANTPSSKTTKDYVLETEAAKPTYTQSEAVKNMANTLAGYESKKPGEYKSAYADQIDNILNGILNREKFSYDFNADPIYQQYKDQYANLGQQAMQDTMGNAAMLTGGYGNSYASTAGNQAYQSYLQQLNNVIPELYNSAYNRYQNEGQDMYNNISLLQGMDEADYAKYRDNVNDYYNDLTYYYTKYNDMSSEEYNRYLNDLSAWQNDRAYYYGKQQDEQAQQNWQTQWDYQVAQDAAKAASGGERGTEPKYQELNENGTHPEEVKAAFVDIYNYDGIEQAIAFLENALANGRIGTKVTNEIYNKYPKVKEYMEKNM